MTAGPAAVDRVAGLLARRIGLRVDRLTRQRLARALELGGQDAEACARAVDEDPLEFERLVDLVTVQESAFFRHAEHFDVLVEHLLSPEALATSSSERLIWCAGCANGEEAWSLAMLLEEQGSDWSVVASDVSRGAVARAQEGVYAERRAAGLHASRRSRFLRPAGGGHVEIAESLRERVRFVQHNLASGAAPLEAGSCAVVFCRNVLIYLRPGIQRRLLDHLRDRMPARGLLVLGGAESIAPGDPAFVPEKRAGAFVYRPRPRVTAARPRPLPAPATARTPVRRSRRAAADRPSAALGPTAADHAAAGERLAADGDHLAAAGAFRRATYLAPEDPLHHLRLGLALEHAGDDGARRAFRAAQAALAHVDRKRVEPALDGWPVEELERMLAARVREGGSR